jgi:tetratricopeptide (TPR) repeat protein
VHNAAGDYDRVIELATGNLAALPADWVHETLGLGGPSSVWDWACLVQSLAELGRFAEAASVEAEMIRIAEPTQHALTMAMALFSASMHHILKGDWTQALLAAERWVAMSRAGKFSFHLCWGVASSTWPMAQLGTNEALNRIMEAEPLLERIVAGRFLACMTWFYCALGRASLLLGRRDEARRFGNRALEFCASQLRFEAHAWHLLGDVAADPDQFDAERGEAHYRQALTIAESLGMRPLIAHCHLGLGSLCRRTGRRDEARDHLTTATMMYRDMDMTYWLEQAEAESQSSFRQNE